MSRDFSALLWVACFHLKVCVCATSTVWVPVLNLVLMPQGLSMVNESVIRRYFLNTHQDKSFPAENICDLIRMILRWPIRAKHNSIPVLKHNNLLKTQQSFGQRNNLFENTTIFSITQQSIREHNSLFQNTRNFPDAQQSFPKHNNIF